MILMPRGNVQEMFDIIVASLDFGSGFLDLDQVEQLRSVAELLGVDPVKATPRNYLSSYPHAFEMGPTARCARCDYFAGDALAHPA